MAIYNNAIQTKAGIKLSNEMIAGMGKMEFTCLKTGSGTYTEKEKKRESIQEMTELKECRQTFCFSSIIPQDADYIQLKAYATNLDLEEGYNLTELGIYARVSDGEEEILYCIITTEAADYMPVYNGKIYEIIFRFIVRVFDVENVQIQYKNESYALAEDLAIHLGNKSNPHKLKAVQIPYTGQTGQTNMEDAMRETEILLGNTSINDIGDGTVTGSIQIFSNNIEQLKQSVKIGSSDTDLQCGDTLFVVEGTGTITSPGIVYTNFALSESPPDMNNWGIIEGKLAVSENIPHDVAFFAKIE